MKKIIGISLAALSFVFATSVFAAEKAPVKKVETKATVAQTINLYESPETTAKIIKQLPANTNLVGIYQKGDWMKVGDREDGSTGWINLKQYHQAKQDFYQQYFHVNSESIYVSTKKDKNGKTVIEAYKNGKKLSDADAKKLYDQMQAQTEKQFKAMQQFNQEMDLQMQRELMIPPMTFMPGIVVIEKPVVKKEETKK